MVMVCHWWELPQVSFLSRQTYACSDKPFVATKIILVAALANDRCGAVDAANFTVLAGSAQWLAGLLGDNTTPCPGRNSGPVGRGPMAGTVDRLSVTVLSEKAQEFWLFMAD